MHELEAVLFVRRPGLGATLAQNARQIFGCEERVFGGVLSSGERKEFFDEDRMRHCLVGLQRRIKS